MRFLCYFKHIWETTAYRGNTPTERQCVAGVILDMSVEEGGKHA